MECRTVGWVLVYPGSCLHNKPEKCHSIDSLFSVTARLKDSQGVLLICFDSIHWFCFAVGWNVTSCDNYLHQPGCVCHAPWGIFSRAKTSCHGSVHQGKSQAWIHIPALFPPSVILARSENLFLPQLLTCKLEIRVIWDLMEAMQDTLEICLRHWKGSGNAISHYWSY